MQRLKLQLTEMEASMEGYTIEMQDTKDDPDDTTTKVTTDINSASVSQSFQHNVVGAIKPIIY